MPLFWTSVDISSGFQSQSRQPYSHLAEADKDLSIFPEIHLWCLTWSPLGGQHGSRPSSSHNWEILLLAEVSSGVFELKTSSVSDKRATNWAIRASWGTQYLRYCEVRLTVKTRQDNRTGIELQQNVQWLRYRKKSCLLSTKIEAFKIFMASLHDLLDEFYHKQHKCENKKQ